MRNKQREKGFTLIEMLIVIAVIAVLAGVVLTNVSGFQASARDTRRMGDLRNVQNYLELFYNRCGYYPGSISGTSCETGDPQDWEALTATMESNNFTSNFPNDPVDGRTYYYEAGTDNLDYVIGAELERENRVLDDDFNGTAGSLDCSGLFFCIES